MAVIRVDFATQGTTLPAADATRLARGTGPIVVVVHGYKYLPDATGHCPHRTIYNPGARLRDPRLTSWSHHLRAGGTGQPDVIGFGWPGRGTIWQAQAMAGQAAQALADLARDIARIARHRPLMGFGHSLGAAVILCALRAAPLPVFARCILLAPAEFQSRAQASLHSPGGAGTEALCVTSRENDLFDAMLEWSLPAPQRGDRIIGAHGLRGPGAVTLQLDDPASLAATAWLGFRIAPPSRRVCHWSVCLRPGAFPLYRALLHGQLPLTTLGAALPRTTPPRWSRFFPPTGPRTPLTTGHQPA